MDGASGPRQRASRSYGAALAVFVLALLALAMRCAWIAYADFQPIPFADDAGAYNQLARGLTAYHQYANLDGTPGFFWPPGYPFFLAGVYRLTGDSLTAALAANALLGAATIALVYGIAVRAFDRATAYLAAAMTALLPSLIFLAGVTLSEVLFTFLLMLALLLIVESGARGRLALAFSAFVVIGLAALVRGQALLIPLAIGPFWWRTTGSWRPALAYVGGGAAVAMLVVVPWTVRNAYHSGEFIPIAANAGPDLYIGHSPESEGRAFIPQTSNYAPGLTQEEAQVRDNREYSRRALRYAFTHPLRELELPALKFYWLFHDDHDALAWNEGHGAHTFLSSRMRDALSAASDISYWAVLLCVTLGVRTWCSLRHPVRLLLLCVVVYWSAIHMVFFGEPRFHAPILPVLAIWAAAAIVAFSRSAWPRRRQPSASVD